MATLDLPPRRPGFTSGQEATIWRGSPSMLSTLYFWVFSFAAAIFMYDQFGKLMASLYNAGFFYDLPRVVPLFYSAPAQLKPWAQMLPSILCVFPVFWYSLGLVCTSYRLTNQRLHIRSGILVRTHDQLELFRVRDFILDAPVYLLILGIANVRVISRDESLPLLTLIAQRHSEHLMDLIRENVQRRRDEVGMREIETNTQ